MGGTRLAVHSIFVVQLICLVTISFLYASTRPFNPSFSAEPFISDQSGWKLLEESIDLVPLHDGSIGGYVHEYLDKLVAQVKILLELGVEEEHIRHHERQTSVFVQRMKQKISELPLTFINDSNNDDNKNHIVLPQLKMNLYMPLFIDDAKNIDKISRALEKGVQGSSSSTKQGMASPGINLLTTITNLSKVKDVQNMKSCDEWELPEPAQSNQNTRQIKSPDLYLLTGCSKFSVDVPLNSDAIVIRTTYTDKDVNGLEHHLQSEISPILLKIVYGAKKSKQRRLERISVQLIDEDPSSHTTASAKRHFELLSKAFFSSLQSTFTPMLSDLSLLYGGNVDGINQNPEGTRTLIWKDAIDLSSSSLAYRQLPNDVIEMEDEGVDEAIEEDVNGTSEGENASVLEKVITTQHMSKCIQSQSSQQNNNKDVEWVVFIPSKDHSPLFLRDKVTGDKGQSIILSSESTDIPKPAGMSLVEIDNVNDVESDEMYGNYKKSISRSLIYLAGYIRELSGLPPSLEQCTNLSSSSTTTTTTLKCLGGNTQQLSFWELESIAQSHWHPVLQHLLYEIDAVMSLLHGHGSTLALPEHVVQKINKATQLLRQSISFAEEGLPVMYATSILYAALEQIESVQMASDLFELSYFAPDHYLAVFSPLVLPLMMPMIFGLLRELKRYKQLKRKKQSA